MVFPIGDDQVKGGFFPLFSYGFIVLNVLVFYYQLQLSGDELQQFIFEYGSLPAEVTQGKDLFTLFTSMFLHGGWMHLIGNMLFLWVFADNIEATIGNFRFLVFYILGGLAAHLGHIFFNFGSEIPTVGASGAISAVLGAYLVMFSRSRIKLWVFPIFFFKVPALLFLGFWIVQQFMSVTAEMGVETANSAGVAWWAHIAGFVFWCRCRLFVQRAGAARLVGGASLVLKFLDSYNLLISNLLSVYTLHCLWGE